MTNQHTIGEPGPVARVSLGGLEAELLDRSARGHDDERPGDHGPPARAAPATPNRRSHVPGLRRRTRSGLLALAVLAAAVVGACGGGGGTEDWVVLDV